MKNLTIILSLFVSGMLHAQHETCGAIPTQEALNYLESTNTARQNYVYDRNNNIIEIPVVNHIVRTNSGTGGLSTSQLAAAMQDINNFYAAADIVFSECQSVNFINNTNWYDFDSSQEGAVAAANDVPNALNIYHFNTVSIGDFAACGYAYFPPGPDRIAMNRSCTTNGATLIHEIGHYLSLFHTHGTQNCGTTDELVNGSNCGNRGDRVCDTPADPNLRYNPGQEDCDAFWVDSDCVYTGNFTDANGQSYTPQTDNIMSYSSSQCRTRFTNGQFNRLRFSAVNDRDYLSCGNGNSSGIVSRKINVSTGNSNDWDQINFPTAFDAPPIVVTGPAGFAGGNPSTVRVRNVTTTGFQIQIDEWDYLDGGHATEQVTYIAAEPGTYNLGNITMIAGSANNIDHNFKTVNFSNSFSSTPVVMASQVTSNGGQATSVRMTNVSNNNFQARIQEEQNNDGFHADETLHYMAFSTGTGSVNGSSLRVGSTGNNVNHNWYTVNFGSNYSNAGFIASCQSFFGGDPLALRYRNLGNTSVQVKLEEEQSGDSEVAHTTETIGYVIIGGSVGDALPDEGGFDNNNTVQIKNYPNPFSSATNIEFTLPEENREVTLYISDMMGRKVATLLNYETVAAGVHTISFDGSAYPAGMYYYTLQMGEFMTTEKMMLVK